MSFCSSSPPVCLFLFKLFQYLIPKCKNAVSPSASQVRSSCHILAILSRFLTGTKAVIPSNRTYWGFTTADIIQLVWIATYGLKLWRLAEMCEAVQNCFVFMMISFSSFQKEDHELNASSYKSSSWHSNAVGKLHHQTESNRQRVFFLWGNVLSGKYCWFCYQFDDECRPSRLGSIRIFLLFQYGYRVP